MKKNNKKGFTLAELLIVVAIIAVLVAIAIPVFTSQLEKSRDAVSVSNMRSGYAEIMTCVIAGTTGQDRVTGGPTDGNGGDGTYTVPVVIKSQQANSWSGVATDLAFTPPADPGTAGDYTLSITVANSAVTGATLTAASSGG